MAKHNRKKIIKAEVKKAYCPDGEVGKGEYKESMNKSNELEYVGSRKRGAHVNTINASAYKMYSFREEEELFKSSKFIQRILSIPLLDAKTGGVEVVFTNETDQNRYDNYIKEKNLDPLNTAIMTRLNCRKNGTSAVYPYITGQEDRTDQPITTISSVERFIIWTEDLIVDYTYDDNPFSLNYLLPKIIKIDGNGSTIKVDPTRMKIFWNDNLIPYNGRIGVQNTLDWQGISTINKLAQEITGYFTGKWSLSEIIYRISFLLFKGEKMMNLTTDEKNDLYRDINALTHAHVGPNDNITSINTGGGIDPKIWIQGLLLPFSAATGIPIYRLLGLSEGALATSEENRIQYNTMIESVIRPQLEEVMFYCIDTISKAINLGEYEIKWKDLNTIKDKDKAEIDKIKMETIKVLFESIALARANGREEGIAKIVEGLAGRLDLELDEEILNLFRG